MLLNGNVVYIKDLALNIHLMLLFLHITQGQEYRSVIHRNFFTFNVKHCSCLHQVLNDDEQKSIFYTCILRRVIFEQHNFIQTD